jgi:molecular chaperone DnaK
MILSRAIGIDLGTTNSAVAFLDPNERDLVLGKDPQGRPSIPSCVWADPGTGDIVVGHRAYARRGSLPAPVSSIKRSMGARIRTTLGEAETSPVEVSAHILRELKRQMETELAGRYPNDRYDVRRAIITVPAYFGLAAIEATRQAGELAGLEVAELLHEPTAAAIYYSWKHDLGDGVYLVYDLGGGTFDASVLRRVSGEFAVLGISGDNFLGGDDFDRRLAEHLRRVLVAEGYDLELDIARDPADRLRFGQLMVLAERAKKQLSDAAEIVLRDQSTLRDRSAAPVVVEIALDRATLNGLIDDLLDRTVDACNAALDKARRAGDVTIDQIDHVVLVGGSTYLPAVVEKVRDAFCAAGSSGGGDTRTRAAEPVRDEPETAVGLGAALRAAALGVGLGDDDNRLRLWFRGPGATRHEATTISGHVEVLQPNLSVAGGEVRLLDSDGEVLRETRLTAEQRFVLPKVELQPETINELRFEVADGAGTPIAEIQRSIHHSVAQQETVGSAMSTAVLAEPVVLEGTDGDSVVRRVLLTDGTPLPATAGFTFAVADDSGHVRLPVYQGNRIIKELHADVGPVAVGTPVRIEIDCDDKVHITVRATVGSTTFGGRIEPPPPESVPTSTRLRELDRQLSATLARLEEADSEHVLAAYRRIRNDLDEALAGGDNPKVIQRAADLEGVLRDALRLLPLEPPLSDLEADVQACLDMLPSVVRRRPELASRSLRQDLEQLLTDARTTHAARDRDAYQDASTRLTAMLRFLSGVTVENTTQIDPTLRADVAVEHVRQLLTFVMTQCLNHREHMATIQRHLTELYAIEERIAVDPIGVLNRCQVLLSEAQRIQTEIAPAKRPATNLAGLLRVRGAADPGPTHELFTRDHDA